MNAFPRAKIPVAVLGATGTVGQKFVELLAAHPWFEIVALAASDGSIGKPYREAIRGPQASPFPDKIAEMKVMCCEPGLPCHLVFSALDAGVAGEVERRFAQERHIVVSNCRNHRLDPDVPLLVPEVNADHLPMVKCQRFAGGMIVTNPNCSTTGLVIALKPLLDAFGLEAVHVVTLQAISGAGYPGVASLDILDNVLPYIAGEEEKLQREPLKILGKRTEGRVCDLDIKISAQCNRVPVLHGHLECVSVRLARDASREDLISAWLEFSAEPQRLELPMAPMRPIYYSEDMLFPQPKLHRSLDKSMAVSIGRLQKCSLLDYKFVLLSHNLVRGAAGGAILCAELMMKKGYIA